MKANKFLNFTSIPVILLAILLFISFTKRNNSDIENTKKMMLEIKSLRVAINNYYLKTNTFPNLHLEGANNDLNLIKEQIGDEEFNFAKIYGSSKLAETPTFKNLKSSNKVYNIENFKEVSNNGGWNYNKNTGEIHINLPYNFFEQGIDWNNF